MEVMTIREFADAQGISYEAVRKQVVRYSDELSGHVIRKNRTQYLDETAVEFLKERRRESPIVLQTIDQADEISRLQDQMEALKAQLVSAQNKLLESQERIISLQEDVQKAIEDRVKYTALLEDKEASEKKLLETEDLLRGVEAERDEALQKARELLRDDSKSIEQIAEMVGYNDYFYFTKVFKKYQGISPSKYRKNL